MLKAVPGTSQANDSGNDDHGLNKTSLKLFLPGGNCSCQAETVPARRQSGPARPERSAKDTYCSTSAPTKIEAARKLKATLSDILGLEVIIAAEETVRA